MDTIKIELNLEGVRLGVMNALNARNDAISGMVEAELNRLLSVDYIQAIVAERVATSVRAALVDSIDAYFKYGRGAEEIRRAAHAKLDSMLGAVGE